MARNGKSFDRIDCNIVQSQKNFQETDENDKNYTHAKIKFKEYNASDTTSLLCTEDSTYINLDEEANETIVEECPSVNIQGSPDCEPKLIDMNFKTPHSQRRVNRIKKFPEPNTILENPADVVSLRHIPGPVLKWPGCEDVWLNMVYKEEATNKTRNCRVFNNRSSYLPRMRAILVDWIMEVCEVYHLHRNTYYLALDYIDRYLTVKPSVPKTHLQLLGVTCLFIASKLEEIYPPKLSEFSYVCDGACTEEETLGWDVNPMTPSGWLNLYMQIHYDMDTVLAQGLHADVNRTFQFPAYSAYQFIRASHIIDLFSLDPGYVRFSYSVIAAAAMFFIFGRRVARSVTGLPWSNIELCVAHMSVFHQVLGEADDPRLYSVSAAQEEDERQMSSYRALRTVLPQLMRDENHAMQTHLVDLDYFERAVLLRLEYLGFDVQKTYVKKKSNRQHSPTDLDEDTHNEEDTEEIAEESTVVMYQLQRPDDLDNDCDSEIKSDGDTSDEDKEPNRLNIFAIREIVTVNFDDILASVHNDCTEKLFLDKFQSLYELDSL